MWNLIISTSCYPVLFLFRFISDEEIREMVAFMWVGFCLMALINGIIALIKEVK